MKRSRRVLPALLLSLSLTLSSAGAAVLHGYREGLAKAEEDGLWGFADVSGAIVVPIQYQSVLDFTLGTALVQTGNKLGLIRQDGTYLLDPEYDTLENLGYGLYLAQQGNSWGVVSILAFPGEDGAATQAFFPIQYDTVRIGQMDGLEVLLLTQDGVETVTPLASLPQLMVERDVPSARFPLLKGRLPSFSDVEDRDWFSVWVDIAYNVGLTSGVGGNRYAPEQTLTVAEVLKLAATMESRYKDDSFHTSSSTGPYWYSGAVNYCLASGIIQNGTFSQKDYLRPATRREIAQIFAATSQAKHMKNINDLSRIKVSVPDVKPGDPGADAIYSLYAKGVLTGVDSKLTFNPKGTVTRAEAAAIVARMARAEQRLTLWRTFNPNVLAA